MSRTKSIASRKHRKIRKAAKGYKHSAGKRVRVAKEALLHAGHYAYTGRKLKKRNIKRLWIIRINAAARLNGMSYSKFVAELNKSNIELDRKMLSEIASNDPDTFKQITSSLK